MSIQISSKLGKKQFFQETDAFQTELLQKYQGNNL